MKVQAYADRLQKLGGVVYSMERHGVPIDLDVCAEIQKQAQADEVETLARLNALAGETCGIVKTNWNYAQWLVEFLHAPRPFGLGLKPSPYWGKGKVRLEKGERKTDAKALDWLTSQNPEFRQLLNDIRAYRRQHRMANYAETWQSLAIRHDDGSYRLHPSFGMADDTDDRAGAKTGRFGIKNPALQQVPHDKKKDPYRLRRAFVATPGHVLVVADYSQLEVVILAHICVRLFGMTGLRDRLLPGKPDMHSATAKYVFGDTMGNEYMQAIAVDQVKGDPIAGRFRDLIKAVRYGLAYCKGSYGFGNTLFETDDKGDICGPAIGEARAQVLIDALKGMDPELGMYQEWVPRYLAKHKMMPSLEGRWAPALEITSDFEWAVKRVIRQMTNWPMQAGGQEVVLAAMIALWEAGVQMSLQVHDELHFMVPEDELEAALPLIQDLMEHTTRLEAPLKASPGVGANWEEAK